MLAFAAKRMGFEVRVIDPTPQSPAGQVCDEQIIADYTDEQAIRRLSAVSDFLTYEIELAHAALLEELTEKGVHINPSPKTLTVIKDKLLQKRFLNTKGIPVADFTKVTTKEDILKVAKKFGYPFLLKARFDAYDGRGNALIKQEPDIDPGLEKLAGRTLYVEKFVPFVKELAVIACRDMKGNIATFPIVETVHKNNILHIVYAPAHIEKSVYKKAESLAKNVMQHLHGAGVFGIELFLTKNGDVLVNEISPRVHNSGHYTIEACVTSQFEQHIRAITGLPLGSTEMLVPAAVMLNILGHRSGTAEVTGLKKALHVPNVSVHIYGKSETKPERKMGHITATGISLTQVYGRALQAKAFLTI